MTPEKIKDLRDLVKGSRKDGHASWPLEDELEECLDEIEKLQARVKEFDEYLKSSIWFDPPPSVIGKSSKEDVYQSEELDEIFQILLSKVQPRSTEFVASVFKHYAKRKCISQKQCEAILKIYEELL